MKNQIIIQDCINYQVVFFVIDLINTMV